MTKPVIILVYFVFLFTILALSRPFTYYYIKRGYSLIPLKRRIWQWMIGLIFALTMILVLILIR